MPARSAASAVVARGRLRRCAWPAANQTAGNAEGGTTTAGRATRETAPHCPRRRDDPGTTSVQTEYRHNGKHTYFPDGMEGKSKLRVFDPPAGWRPGRSTAGEIFGFEKSGSDDGLGST